MALRCHDDLQRKQRAILPTWASALLMSTVAGQSCFAQSATPGTAVTLDPITVEASRSSKPATSRERAAGPRRADSAPAPARETAAGSGDQAPATVRERFEALAGGVALVGREDFPITANPTVSKALSGVPGVVVQDFFGGNDQPRIQIRGSGLQQNPVERGILVLQNGLPINRADGSYIVGFANPQQAESIEVYRGYMANRLGATVLGGALNFVSPTGSSSPGTQVTASGGSFGQIGVSGQQGARKDNFDAFIQADFSRRDGFRDYNTSERSSFNANFGAALSENVSTRFFIGYTDLGFDVAGPLTKSQMEANPRQVSTGPTATGLNPGPNVVRDRPRREAEQFLAGSRTTATFGAHLFDVALGYTHTDDMFRFPISAGIRNTQGDDATGVFRYAYKPDSASILPLLETTMQYSVGSADRQYSINQSGQTGAKFGQNQLDATTLALYTGLNLPIWEAVTLSPAISYGYATRDNDDTYNGARRPTIAYNPANPTMLLPGGSVTTHSTSYNRSYDAWSPSLGLTFRPTRDQTVFAAVSRSFEPPTHDDLLATVNGTPNSSPGRPTPPQPGLDAAAFSTPDLKAQTATTVEGGWRGRSGNFSWDAVTYYSWVNNELLSLRDATGAPLGSVNADKTTHFGVELGLGMKITERLTGRVAYTYQDFRFVDDPLRGNNRLAGAPPQLLNAMLQYQATEAWKFQGAVRWVPVRTPVDNMNTLYADPYVVADVRAEYRISEHFWVFGEVTNIFDKTYASSTLVVDQARPDQAAFLPGDGRGYYGGVKAKF
jgi:iron complex outermembrane receptor protein